MSDFDLQSSLEAIDHGQQRFDCLHAGKVAEILLLFAGTPAGVFKFRLRASQAIQQGIALGLQFLQSALQPRRYRYAGVDASVGF